MTNTPSIKNVSTADLETALAATLKQLTGWPVVRVNVEQIGFGNAPSCFKREDVSLNLRVSMETEKKDDGLPF